MAQAHPIYVPVLKGKEGEFAALEALDNDIRDRIMPLIEAPSVPYDYANERPAKSLDEHIGAFGDRMRRGWSNRPVFVDLPWFGDEEQLGDGRVAMDALLSTCQEGGVAAVPVVGRGNSAAYLSAVKRYVSKSGTGASVRLLLTDFEEDEDIDLAHEVERLLDAIGAQGRSSVDLLVDLGDLGADSGKGSLIARSVLSLIPAAAEWRRVILLAASFPEDLSSVDRSTFTHRPRREWDLWKTLQRRPAQLPRRDLIFGDYAISHPELKELDPRTMRMSASIRYTTADSWLIAKGQNVRQYGFDQYFELCRELVGRQDYSGREFSWGDEYIADCAVKRKGPGNATTWRKVGTNHHLTLVTRALATLAHGA